MSASWDAPSADDWTNWEQETGWEDAARANLLRGVIAALLIEGAVVVVVVVALWLIGSRLAS